MVPRPRQTALALLLLATLVSGCPRKRSAEEALGAALATADVAWRDRGTDGLEPVGAALDAAEELAPGHPEIAWRRVRLGIAQGFAAEDPIESLRAYARARDDGLRCIRGGTSGLTPGDTEAVLRGVSDAQAPCMAWTALAWTRWLEAFGPEAAALDLRRIDAILSWSLARPPLGPPHDDVVAWADGVLWAVRPVAEGRDLQRGSERLRAVAEDHPDDAVVLLDLLELVALPLDDRPLADELTATLQQADLDTPEERGAVGRWRDQGAKGP